MKLAIIGSRNLHVENFEKYLPENVTEIVSGGAKGIDTDAEAYANQKGIKVTVFKPDYRRFRGGATHIRNKEIVNYADEVIEIPLCFSSSIQSETACLSLCLPLTEPADWIAPP